MKKSKSTHLALEIQQAEDHLNSAQKLSSIDDDEIIQTTLSLSSGILKTARYLQTAKEKRESRRIAQLHQYPGMKTILVLLADRLFRTKNAIKTKELLFEKKSLWKSLHLHSFLERWLVKATFFFISFCPSIGIPILRFFIRKKMTQVIFEKNSSSFFEFLSKSDQEGLIINVNRLGEAILGEREAQKRFQNAIEDLSNPLIKSISIKLSSLFSTISPLGFQETILPKMREKLLILIRTAKKMNHKPCITLDMEEYKDLYLTQELICDISQEEDTLDVRFGLALQAYIPDSHEALQKILIASQKRREKGGKSLYIRLVKGANLLVEQFEARLKNWPQAPFHTKKETDINYLRLMKELFLEAQKGTIEVGIATHNIFDIAYSLVLSQIYGIQKSVWYEMLQGMAPSLARAVQKISQNRLILYCPVAEKDEVASTIAYLIRRLDENMNEGHFLPLLAEALTHETSKWQLESENFIQILKQKDSIFPQTYRKAYSFSNQLKALEGPSFINCPDVDWSRPENRAIAEQIKQEWQNKKERHIPLYIEGKEYISLITGERREPSRPEKCIHTYSLAEKDILLSCIENMTKIHSTRKKEAWPVQKQVQFLYKLSEQIEKKRLIFIGAMLQEIAKPIPEADSEVSEAIDFCRYYAELVLKESPFCSWRNNANIAFVASPWNFPLALSLQHILQAILSGYTVLYKPSLEAVGIGALLIQTILEAGLDPDYIAFVPMKDNPEGLSILQHPDVNALFLTGSTKTGRLFLQHAQSKRLYAETGGKNAVYVSSKSDVDLAIRDIIRSAFSFSGQKCSALSVLILDQELFHSQSFLMQLQDATESLVTDSAWNLAATVVPLATSPSDQFLRAIHKLDQGEKWLVPPSVSSHNSRLYSPSIKIIEHPGTYSHTHELFGPTLSIISAYDIHDAIRIAHMPPFGLTSGIYTLSSEEAHIWQSTIQAGMVYINRPIVGALVGRQPFGGWKESSFGIGMKVGGPFSLRQLLTSQEPTDDKTKEYDLPINHAPTLSLLGTLRLNEISTSNSYIQYTRQIYGIWTKEFDIKPKVEASIQGQTNQLFIIPRKEIVFYTQTSDSPKMIWAFISMATLTDTKLYLSRNIIETLEPFIDVPRFLSFIHSRNWEFFNSSEEMYEIVKKVPRVKTLNPLPQIIYQTLAKNALMIDETALSMDPKFDFLFLFHEKSISSDVHRYGNILL